MKGESHLKKNTVSHLDSPDVVDPPERQPIPFLKSDLLLSSRTKIEYFSILVVKDGWAANFNQYPLPPHPKHGQAARRDSSLPQEKFGRDAEENKVNLVLNNR